MKQGGTTTDSQGGQPQNHWASELSKASVLAPAVVLAITFGVYIATLTYGFVYDDGGQIVNNPLVQGWQYVPRYFSEHVWSYMYPNAPGNYYRPVFLVWLLLNHTFFGLDPFGWHLTTVAAHTAVTFLVYLLVCRVTGNMVSAIIASLIFGVHPIHIEAVAWISGVTEPLCAGLLLGSCLGYLRYREGESREQRWLILSLALFALAALSKETAIVLPMILFGYEWLVVRHAPPKVDQELPAEPRLPSDLSLRNLKPAFISVLPFLGIALVYLSIRAVVLRGFGHTVTPLSLTTVVYTWPSLLWFYIKALVWPVGLAGFYDTPYVTRPSVSTFILPLGAVLISAGLLLWGALRSNEVRFATLWLILPILPLLNLSVFPDSEIAHDRYLYLPSIGVAMIAGVFFERFRFGRILLAGQQAPVVVLAGGLALFYLVATVVQQGQWQNNLTLYTVGASNAPNSNLATNNLANELLAQGEYDRAIDLYRKVLARNPNFWLANYNLGFASYKLDRLEDAERYLIRAIELNTIDADQHVYLGLTRLKSGRLEEAASSIRRGIEIRGDAIGYHYALGSVLKKQGDFQGALKEFKAELLNNPRLTAAHQQIADIEGMLMGEKK